MRHPSPTATGLVAALALLAAACGGSGPDTAGATGATASADCLGLAAAAVNGFDLVGVDAADGLDAGERRRVEAALGEARDGHPELAEGGPCAGALQVDALGSRVDVHRLAILRAMGGATFTSVPPASKAPEPPTTSTPP